ncbi:MAG: DUF4331 domain-containing protein [Actinobacteria bacterium]|nr:DUF4331 domain-containing protein [Actinomycetota bacterium]
MKRTRRAAVAAVASLALGTGLFAGLGPAPGGASSHREAPLIAGDPRVDNTDVYAFVSPDRPNTVTIISSWIPFEEPAGGPNFYLFDENARYDIKVDNDGDAVWDITYRFTFDTIHVNPGSFIMNNGPVTSLGDPNLLIRQRYDLTRIRRGQPGVLLLHDAPVVPSYVGAASMPNYAALMSAGVRPFMNGTSRAFAGQSDDPFFLDLRVFDLLYGADFSEAGDDTLAGFNVNTLAIQVPKAQLALNKAPGKNPVIGIWSTASRRSTRVQKANGTQDLSGPFVQVSRLGMPLVNEVVIPVGDKDKWNGSKPAGDLANFGGYVTDPELPGLIEAVYGIPAPATPRDDLVSVFVTGIDGLNSLAGNAQVGAITPGEMLRLNMSIPPCEEGPCAEHSPLGVIGGDVAGYPNGRRLVDDVIDISLQVVEGELVGNPNDLADGVDENDLPFGGSFPYVAMPHAGSDAGVHGQI